MCLQVFKLIYSHVFVHSSQLQRVRILHQVMWSAVECGRSGIRAAPRELIIHVHSTGWGMWIVLK